MTLTLVKFPNNLHVTSIVLEDGELILHTKAPECKNSLATLLRNSVLILLASS